MTPERWERINSLFGAALDRPADQRADFLAEVCPNDPELRAEVEALLDADAMATEQHVLTTPLNPDLAPADADTVLDDQLIGRRLGPYEVEALVGRGGMGSVYRAVRRTDFEQVVAIKLIKRGMDTEEVLRRFSTEMHVQAALGQHPHIAAILDAGTTDDGLPYFVMEYIEGQPIDSYCQECRLDLLERLNLFRSVCAAVQFAHSVAVIHRDLKPSNILVTSEGVPKLIDFGIAKWLRGEPGAAAETATHPEHRVLTPQYASPEQVRGEPLSTATDIYSLGVVLYELLTGRRPYRLTTGRIDELLHAVCEQEPSRPSTAVTRQEGEPIGGRSPDEPTSEEGPIPRKEPAWRLRQRLSGDLDNIILMALRKEPERRYASVERFSADIQRHLDGLPVEARPSTFGYRLGKFVRRHRVGVGAAVLIVLLLLGGIVGTIAGMLRAQRSEARAVANEDRAQRAVEELLVRVTENELLNAPGLQDLRRQLLESALSYYEEFLEDNRGDPALRVKLASTYARIAKIQQLIGRNDDALRADREALAILGELIADERRRFSHGTALLDYLHDQATILNNMGLIQRRIGQQESAFQSFRAALASAREVADGRPDRASHQEGLANILNNQALLHGEVGEMPEALAFHDQAIAIQRRLVERDPGEADYQSQLADMLMGIARPRFMLGQDDEALGSIRASIETYQSLLERVPHYVLYTQRLAEALAQFASYNLFIGRTDEARAAVQQAIDTLEPLAESNPLVPDYQSDLLFYYNLLCDLQRRDGELESSLASARRAIEIGEPLINRYPDVIEYQVYFSKSENNLGRLYQLEGRRAESLRSFEQAVARLERITRLDPVNDYNLACNLALAAGVVGTDPDALSDAEQAERQGWEDRAMMALLRAVEGGYVHFEQVRRDTDLDGLRNRDDFRALIERLQPNDATPNPNHDSDGDP